MKWVEVTAVAAAALSVAYAASAETLHVTYVGGGEDPSTGLYVLMNVSWDTGLESHADDGAWARVVFCSDHELCRRNLVRNGSDVFSVWVWHV